MSFWKRFGKPLASVAVAVVTAIYAIFNDGGDVHIDPVEGVAIVIAFANALMTYIVPLVPEYRWAKTAVGAALAGLQVLATVIVGGLHPDEVVLIILAVAQALGIVITPATSNNGVSTSRATASLPSPAGPM